MLTLDDFRRNGSCQITRVRFDQWWLVCEYLLAENGDQGFTYDVARAYWDANVTPGEAVKSYLAVRGPTAPVKHDIPMPGDPDGPVTINRVLDEVQKAKRYPRGEIRLRRDEHGHEFRALLREYAGANPDVRDFGNRFDAVAWLKERGCAEEAILHVGFTP